MGPEGLFMLLASGLAVTTVLWLRERSARYRIERRLWQIAAARGIVLPEMTQELAEVEHMPHPRIDQLEGQVDQIAQQLERLNDSQEFLARLMTQRLDDPRAPRLDTPH